MACFLKTSLIAFQLLIMGLLPEQGSELLFPTNVTHMEASAAYQDLAGPAEHKA